MDVFLFDPRQSEIEIKQIIGRSVRPLRYEDNNALPWDEQTPLISSFLCIFNNLKIMLKMNRII